MSLTLLDLLNNAAIGNQGGVGEPQRVNSIILVIPGGQGVNGDEISLALQEFTIPKMLGTSNTVQIQRGLVAKKFAGNVAYDELQMNFKDYLDRKTAQTLLQWRAQVYNPLTKQVNAARVYKRYAEVHLIAPWGAAGPTDRVIQVKGLWPTVVDLGTAQLESDETVNIQSAFQYDECLPGPGFDDITLSALAGQILTSIGGALQNPAGAFGR